MKTTKYHLWLPHRQPKRRFGKSMVGRILNWVTGTWHRWNVVCLFSTICVARTVMNQDPALLPIQLLTAIPIALLLYPLWLILIRLMTRVAGLRIVVGIACIVYYSLFSWLVVEKAPAIGPPTYS